MSFLCPTPSPPPAPDYTGAAAAQGAANVETARASAKLSNPNIYSPYGTQLVSYEGDVPTIRQTLTPQAQQTLLAQQRVQTGLADLGEQGIGTARKVLSTPFAFGGPAVQTSLGQFDALQSAPAVGSFGMAGSVNPSQYGQAGTVNTGEYGRATALNPNQYGQSGSINASEFGRASALNPNQYGTAGGININQLGQAQGGVSGPNITSSLDLSNVARMPINAGTTGQEAILSRLEPSIQRNRVSTETQLINQGLRPGTEAYDNAIKLLGQQENDQRQQAALQGLNLDLSANQQGFGQALAGGQFGNQAQLSGFGANLQNQQAANQALAQNVNQQLAAQQLANQAISQNFGQGSAAQQMANQAIAQNYAQGLSAQQLANQAVSENFGRGSAAQQMANQAIAQNFGQGLSAQQLANQAIAQNFGQGANAQQMANQAIAQNYGQGLTASQTENARIAQQFNQAQQAAQFGNIAQQQALAQAIQNRQMPLNEISALMSGSQIQNPQFAAYQGQTITPPNIAGAAAQQGAFNQNLYNQQVAGQNAQTTGLFQLGAAALPLAFSDIRLKSNIVQIGVHPIGVGIYEYDIFGGRQIGVMAQELAQVMPEAVHQHPSGYLMVDYGRL